MLGLGQDDQAGVGVEVDEAGADDAPGGIYALTCLDGGDITAQDLHGFAVDAHRTWKPDVARPVDNLPAGDQYIEHAGDEATILTDYAVTVFTPRGDPAGGTWWL